MKTSIENNKDSKCTVITEINDKNKVESTIHIPSIIPLVIKFLSATVIIYGAGLKIIEIKYTDLQESFKTKDKNELTENLYNLLVIRNFNIIRSSGQIKVANLLTNRREDQRRYSNPGALPKY